MADDVPPLIAPSTGDAATRSLVEDVKNLVEDGRTLVEAELAYQKSRAAVAGAGAKGIAGWTLLALALIFFTLMALVVGLLLALAPAMGSWGALLTVVLGLLTSTALSAWVALRRWKRVRAALAETDPAP
ncbi:MAG: phage holin family protein [Novosphingobium sp.]|uniref:phage holin family protein n=1 Tax=Novosphingobium sp. TaxID=1874826 RepID=UPI0032B79D26